MCSIQEWHIQSFGRDEKNVDHLNWYTKDDPVEAWLKLYIKHQNKSFLWKIVTWNSKWIHSDNLERYKSFEAVHIAAEMKYLQKQDSAVNLVGVERCTVLWVGPTKRNSYRDQLISSSGAIEEYATVVCSCLHPITWTMYPVHRTAGRSLILALRSPVSFSSLYKFTARSDKGYVAPTACSPRTVMAYWTAPSIS